MILLFSRREDGHRRSYLDVFARLFASRRARAGELLLARDPVLFLMIEENFPLYALVAVLRAAMGRRTAGVAVSASSRSPRQGARLAIKRGVLGLLKRLPAVSTLTILPFAVEPGFERIASGWIYDPQLWDLTERDRAIGTTAPALDSYLAPALHLSGSRRIAAAIGRMDRAKGFDSFARAYIGSTGLRDVALFVACGRVSGELADDSAAFSQVGGIVIDRQVSDDELLEAYAAADLVWCCYAADYDQASGIFGRAAQLGIPVIVRAGSLIEKFCIAEGLAHHAIDPAGFTKLPESIAEKDPVRGKAMAAAMASHSIPVLAEALGVAPADA